MMIFLFKKRAITVLHDCIVLEFRPFLDTEIVSVLYCSLMLICSFVTIGNLR